MKKTSLFLCLATLAGVLGFTNPLSAQQKIQRYSLEKTIWYNLSSTEHNETKGNLFLYLHFRTSDTIAIYATVSVDTCILVQPFLYAIGTYSVSGNPKKEAKIEVEAESVNQKKLSYKGAFHKEESMFLVSQDSICRIYGKLKDTKL